MTNLESGFDEVVYQKAFEVGLRSRRIPYEAQRVVRFPQGFYIGKGKRDLVVGETPERVVIETKSRRKCRPQRTRAD